MPSAWLKRYQQASFRNIEFYIKGHSVTGGRRLAKHSFPGNNVVQFEDMGRKEPTFTLDAYIVADDYFKHRNDFETALNADGAGKLVHPYRGTLSVYCADFTLSETTDEGRMVRFSITFALADIETLTVVNLGTKKFALRAKTSLLTAIHNAFLAAYSAMSLAVNQLNALVGALDTIDSLIEDAKLLMQPYAEFQAIVSNAKGKLVAIALDAESLVSSFEDMIGFGSDTNQSVQPTSTNSLPQFTSLIASVDAITTQGPATELEQEDQMILLQQKITLACASSLLLTAEFDSADTAQDAIDALFTRMDTVLEDPTTTDEEYTAFTTLKAAIYTNVAARALQLAKLKTITLDETTPSLVLINTLYGSTEQEDAMLQRNKIRHPVFTPGGVPLKVLTNV